MLQIIEKTASELKISTFDILKTKVQLADRKEGNLLDWMKREIISMNPSFGGNRNCAEDVQQILADMAKHRYKILKMKLSKAFPSISSLREQIDAPKLNSGVDMNCLKSIDDRENSGRDKNDFYLMKKHMKANKNLAKVILMQ